MIEQEPRELVGEIERLLEEIDRLPDPLARDKTTAVVQALLELYGAGLERIVEEVSLRDDGELAAALAADELVAHLLLLHGLHPVALQDRVLGALQEVRPYLESHGGNVELIDIEDGAVRLRLAGSCHGCPSSTMTLKLAIENAIRKAAPEIEEVLAEGQPAPAEPGLLQIELGGGPAPTPGGAEAPPAGGWTMVGTLRELRPEATLVKQVAGQPILFATLDGRFYGYSAHCPTCSDDLAGAKLSATHLTCAGCGHRFDLLRAGRDLDAPAFHLEPVPLLVGDDGLVKVALPLAA